MNASAREQVLGNLAASREVREARQYAALSFKFGMYDAIGELYNLHGMCGGCHDYDGAYGYTPCGHCGAEAAYRTAAADICDRYIGWLNPNLDARLDLLRDFIARACNGKFAYYGVGF